MTYGAVEYAGGGYGSPRAPAVTTTSKPILSVEIAFTTDALATPVWAPVTADVRSWDTTRGRTRELERYQPGRATVVLSNGSRQYDSVNAAGPYFGNIKPMRRIRIRETFDGVTYPTFDGFIDKWVLDYPAGGKDATATVIATDGFKVVARTDPPESVYQQTVANDAPAIWWRLSDPPDSTTALSWGTLSGKDGTYQKPLLGRPGLTFGQPGGAMEVVNDTVAPGTGTMGVDLPDAAGFDLVSGNWSVECWVRIGRELSSGQVWVGAKTSGANVSAQLTYITNVATFPTEFNRQFLFLLTNDAGNLFAVVSPAFQPGERVHLVAKVQANAMTLWANGVAYTTVPATVNGNAVTGRTISGVFGNHDFFVGHQRTAGPTNWVGMIDEFAIYQHASNEPLSDTRIAQHYADGTSPWQGDQASTRLGRVLDLIGWPATWREIETSNVTLQSALLDGTALEHAQKAAESEFGALFMTREGNVRFLSRASIFARTPDPAVFGEQEVPYRRLTHDDGDEVIRNSARISRLNGIAKTAEDSTSVSRYGRFAYVLEGLLHSTDAHSQSYATFVVAEYKDPRRRITTLELGPASADKAATLYPQMLGREIGEAVTVRNRPPGGGATFEQVCVIEGVEQAYEAGFRTTKWILSPDIAGSF